MRGSAHRPATPSQVRYKLGNEHQAFPRLSLLLPPTSLTPCSKRSSGMPAHWRVYQQELGHDYFGYGLPIWEADPMDPKHEIQIGDVGYMTDGRFRRIFNIISGNEGHDTAPSDVKIHPLTLPEASEWQSQQVLIESPILSKHATKLDIGAGAGVVGQPLVSVGGRFRIKYTHTQCAALFLRGPAKPTLYPVSLFTDYAKDRWASWSKYTASNPNHADFARSLTLVYGHTKTKSWTSVVLQHDGHSETVVFNAKIPGIGEAEIELSRESQVIVSPFIAHGPQRQKASYGYGVDSALDTALGPHPEIVDASASNTTRSNGAIAISIQRGTVTTVSIAVTSAAYAAMRTEFINRVVAIIIALAAALFSILTLLEVRCGHGELGNDEPSGNDELKNDDGGDEDLPCNQTLFVRHLKFGDGKAVLGRLGLKIGFQTAILRARSRAVGSAENPHSPRALDELEARMNASYDNTAGNLSHSGTGRRRLLLSVDAGFEYLPPADFNEDDCDPLDAVMFYLMMQAPDAQYAAASDDDLDNLVNYYRSVGGPETDSIYDILITLNLQPDVSPAGIATLPSTFPLDSTSHTLARTEKQISASVPASDLRSTKSLKHSSDLKPPPYSMVDILWNAFFTETSTVPNELPAYNKVARTVESRTTPDPPPYTPASSSKRVPTVPFLERLESLPIIENAILFTRSAIQSTSDDSPDKQVHLDNLGTALRARFEQLGQPEDLDSAIIALHSVVDLSPNYHSHKALALQNLGSALLVRFNQTGKLSDIEDAIAAQHRAIDLTPDDDPSKATLLRNLGTALIARFERFGDLADMQSAIDVTRRSVELTSDVHPDKPDHLNRAGLTLRTRFERLGDVADLDAAITALQQAVLLVPDEYPEKANFLSNLGSALATRFHRLGDIADINNATKVLRTAVDLSPDFHPETPRRLSNLGIALQIRFERLGELADIEESIALIRRAADLTPDNHFSRASQLRYLGIALLTRFKRLGLLSDLEQAIAVQQTALSLTPKDHPFFPTALHNLGTALRHRFERLGNQADMEDAIAVQREAVSLLPNGHHSRSSYLYDLGVALGTRFERFGELTDIESSVGLLREAVFLTPDDHPLKAVCFQSLGSALRTLFERLDELADLDEAIVMQRRAVELTHDDNPSKATCLQSLGTALRVRAERTGEAADIEAAVHAMRRALELTPDDHVERSSRLNALGVALQARFEQGDNLNDIEGATEAIQSAIDLIPEDHPLTPVYLNNIGSALRARFERVGDDASILSSIVALRHAIDLLPDDHYSRPAWLYGLGRSWKAFLSSSHSRAHFESAYEHFSAVSYSSSPPREKLRAASAIVAMYDDFPEFVESLDMTLQAHISIIDALTSLKLGRDAFHRYKELSQAGNQTTAAAAAAITAGRFDLALEWLSEGRNIIWGQLLGLRSPLDDLQLHQPELADLLRQVSAALENSSRYARLTDREDMERLAPSSTLTPQDEARAHRALARQYEELVARVRKLPEFESFLRPQSLDQLSAACRNGPVVVINVHKSRCDGLVLCRPGHVIHVPLPELSLELAEATRSAYVDCFPHRRHDKGVRRILELLWLRVVQPILSSIETELKTSDASDLLHVTWCPTGPLAFLPLHAAGIYGTDDLTGKNNAPSRIVSSYTPSLQALTLPHAQSERNSDPRILVVSLPNTPGHGPLPSTIIEARKIQNQFPDSVQYLEGPSATVEAVVDAVKVHDWIHLACHSNQDLTNPTKSAFHLYDGQLDLSRLMGLSLPHAELAVLSASETAMGDGALPEESMHLAAGMLAAGYKSVIATTASIEDRDAPLLTDALYTVLERQLKGSPEGKQLYGRLNPAYALHEAIKHLRATVGEESFERWIPFVHFGL